jgi:hypothetical protein
LCYVTKNSFCSAFELNFEHSTFLFYIIIK